MPANTSEYASTIHCSCVLVASSSRAKVGRATFRLVLPMMTMMRLVHSTASVHHRRR